MATILFDNYPAHGHYNGSLKLARLLISAGHSVWYAGPAEYQEKTKPLGIRFYIIDPFLIVPVNSEIKEKGWTRYFFESIAYQFNDRRPALIEKKLVMYKEMLDHIQPDLVVTDEHYSYKPIVYWGYRTPVCTIKTGLTAEYSPDIPPFFSTAVPDGSEKSKRKIERIWKRFELKRKVLRMLLKPFYLGRSNNYYHKWLANKFKFPYRERMITRRAYGIRFSNVPSITMPPEAYDFPRTQRRNLYVVGLLPDSDKRCEPLEGRLKNIVDNILSEKSDNKKIKLIYCSLGTVTSQYLSVCTKFFKQITWICNRNPNYRIVLSAGKYFDISKLNTIPDNFFVFDTVPQMSLLQFCDFVITHGGMNTVYECIVAEKPMTVFPLNPHADQNGNGARVVYHHIGNRGILRKTTIEKTESLLRELVENEDKYLVSIRNLKSKFKDRSQYTLELFNQFIKDGIQC